MELVESAKKNLTTGAYAQFSGRASRSEYWWFVLASVLVIIVAAFVDGIAGTAVVTIHSLRSPYAVYTIRTAAVGAYFSALCR
jgi:uncharacterized membrane protein YhaH (DUF805 family)